MKPKTQEVRELVSQGEYKKALQICKDWNYTNPEYGDILRRGYECLIYPEFYRQIGKNPDSEYKKAVDLLLIIYT